MTKNKFYLSTKLLIVLPVLFLLFFNCIEVGNLNSNKEASLQEENMEEFSDYIDMEGYQEL